MARRRRKRKRLRGRRRPAPQAARARPSRRQRRERRSGDRVVDPRHPRDPALAELFRLGANTAAGVDIDAHRARTIAAFYCGVELISNTVKRLPWPVYRRVRDNGRERDREHPVDALLNRRPNPYTTAAKLRKQLVIDAILRGNGYAWIRRELAGGQPKELLRLHPMRVYTHRDGSRLLHRYIPPGREPIDIPDEDVFHLFLHPDDSGERGISVLEYAREALGEGVAAQQHAAKFFRNGAKPSIVLRHPATLEEAQSRNLVESFRRLYGGENVHGIAIVEEGIEVEPLHVNAEEAQLLEQRTFTVQEVARFLNVPPHKLKELSRATFSNIEHQAIEYVGDGVEPWTGELEDQANMKLFTADEQREYFSEFNFEGLLRGATSERYAAYNTALQSGFMTANEVRARENLNPVPGGDEVRFNLGTAPANAPRSEQDDDDGGEDDGDGA